MINTPQQEEVYNVLCLHGKGNNAQTFQQTLKPLEDALSLKLEQHSKTKKIDFDYISAPFPIIADNQQQQQDDELIGYQWWTMPPGVRSFNAKEYQGFEQSSQKVYQQLQQKEYDFIIGHSQGAILLSALLALSSSNDVTKQQKEGYSLLESPLNLFQYESIKGYMLNGCAWPNPFTDQLTSFQYHHHEQQEDSNDHSPQLLFVIGERDKINPPEGAERVKEALDKGGLHDCISTCYHPGGHSVPVKNENALNEMSNWFIDLL